MRESSRTSELKLPTVAVAARLAVVGNFPTAVELFVSDVPRNGRGQLIDDLATQLGGTAGFLPVRALDRVQLLAKHAISWIAVRRVDPDAASSPALGDAGDSSEELTLYDHQHFVEIELVQGTKLVGTLLDSAPIERARVIDHLNAAGRFLRLWTPDEHYLISTEQIVTVTELGEVW